MPDASRIHISRLFTLFGAVLFTAALSCTAARGQGVYVPDSSSPSASPTVDSSDVPSEPTVKSLGTITLAPGEKIDHPAISDDEIDSGDLTANHIAYDEAAMDAYKAHDYAEARTLWEKAARAGDGSAMFQLGGMVERGEGGPKDLDQALGWYYAAAQKGVSGAAEKATALSARLRKEAAAIAAANEAAERAREAAAEKATAANNEDKPVAAPPPEVTPAPATDSAASAPHAQADAPPAPQTQVAAIPSATATPSKAKAPIDSDITAEDAFTRGVNAAAGRGVARSDAEAAKWFRIAADQGYAPAENNLGFMYSEGRGVKHDDAEAAKWYKRAADQGYAPAQTSLGMMYATGRGVPQNDVEALALYSSAASQNYPQGTANLAQMYAEGRGIEKDERTAKFLLSSINEKPRQSPGIYVDPGS